MKSLYSKKRTYYGDDDSSRKQHGYICSKYVAVFWDNKDG